MRDKVLERMEQELRAYREYLIAGKMTVEQLWDESCQMALKQFIVEAVEKLAEENRLSDAVFEWLDGKKSVLEYLYSLWLDCDASLVSGLADILINEVEHDREVHTYE
jgi:hypothetical protein